MVRSLFTAAIEYFLAIAVFKHGKVYPRVFFWVLFFLASYQFGEFFVFATNGNILGFRIAYFSTTMLPAAGLVLVEKITGRKYGSVIVQLLGIIFGASFLLSPDVAFGYELDRFCIHMSAFSTGVFIVWSNYYQAVLLFTMIVMLVNYLKSENEKIKSILAQLLIAYASFDIVSILFVRMIPQYRSATASIMCALAIFAAFIFANISLDGRLDVNLDRIKERIPRFW